MTDNQASQPPRLLVVDDDAAQMNALRDTLEEAGFAATGVSSARLALAELAQHPYDLLLTDLRMPEMNGIELLRAAHDIDAQLVGVVMTGHAAVDTAIDAMKAGALDYVLKPFRLSTMLPVLNRALEVRRLRVEITTLQDRLREYVVELESANKELETFSYSVSHDLRAPLRAINGFSQILLTEYSPELPPPARGLVRHIIDGGKRMGELIDHLLHFSRMSRQPVSRQRVDVSTLVTEVLLGLEAELGPRQIDLQVAELPSAIGDPVLLRQVFANLLSNAFKFTRNTEHARVEIDGSRRNGEVVYVVRDNGAGFDMRYADRLFGVFQRLHPAADYEGTGIGLSLVQRIVHRHGGRIQADAAPGKGATFEFTLPAAPERS